ncbi:MAG: hypothetical protein H7844_04025 [Nitrospirae bacterium YQR-1]
MIKWKLNIFFFKLPLLTLLYSPLFLLLYLVFRFQVNIPFWDEWDITGVFDAFYNGNLFAFLFQQHTDSRMFFPKLVFLFAGLLTGLDMRIFMYLSVFLALLTSICIYVLIQRSFKNTVIAYVNVFFVNLMVFSPVADENWLWGMQFVFYITPLLLCAGLVVNTSGFSLKRKVILNSIFSFVGTFSFANGLLLWLFLFPFNELFKSNTVKTERRYIGVYIILAFACVSVFFLGYEHHIVSRGKWDLVEIIKAFFSGIGGPLIKDNLKHSLLCGLVFFSLFTTVVYKIIPELKDNLRRYYPWLVTACYAAATITLISVNRAGVIYTTASRYMTVSAYFIISSVILLSMYIAKSGNKTKIPVLLPAFFLFSLLYYRMYDNSIDSMRSNCSSRETARASLELSNIYATERTLRALYPDGKKLLKKVEYLTQMRVLNIQIPRLGELTLIADNKPSYGFFTECKELPGEKLYISGNIKTPVEGKRIILSYYTEESGEVFFGSIAPFDGNLIRSEDYYLVFANILSTEAIDRHNAIISAYGIELNRKKIFKFSSTCSVINKKT